MIIRRGTPEHAEAMHELETLLFGADAWSPAMVVSELSSPDRWAAVALSGDEPSTELVGYAVMMRGPDVADLHRIGVREGCRRSGVGPALLDAAVREAHADGVRRMLLEVAEHNEPALAMYAHAGFEEISRRSAYYRDGSDALVLSLELDRAGEWGHG